MRVKESFCDLGVQDQMLKDSELSLLDFMKSIPFEYTRIGEVKSWLYFGRYLLVWLSGLYFGYQLGLIPVWSWFHFVFGLTHIGFHNWKISHNFHHAFSQCIGKDTTWTKGKWTTTQFWESDHKARKDYLIGYGGPIGIMIGYYFAVVHYVWFAKFHPFIPISADQKRQLRKSNRISLCFTLVHFSVYYYLGGWPFYLCFHIIPIMVGAVFVVGVPLLQHAHENAVYFDAKNWSPLRGQILGTYNFRMP